MADRRLMVSAAAELAEAIDEFRKTEKAEQRASNRYVREADGADGNFDARRVSAKTREADRAAKAAMSQVNKRLRAAWPRDHLVRYKGRILQYNAPYIWEFKGIVDIDKEV